ncbi:MAG: prolyl oligopeptidase family protein [Prolixibacteraceae bacterium]
MKKLIPIAIILMACSCNQHSIIYPETRKDQVVDTFYNKVLADPYRWLEDDNSEETASWVDAQNKVTFDFLETLPNRETIKNRLTELWDYPKVHAPFNVSNRWFVFKNDGLQNQDVLFTMNDLESEPYILLDPNKLSTDGTVAFAGMDVSVDGKYLVYKIARSGSDWNEIFVKDIESGELLDDHLFWVKFSNLACFNDGFFYSAYDQPEKGNELSKTNQSQKIYFHRFGEKQSNDKLIYANKNDAKRMYQASIDQDKEHLFISETESTSGNGLYVKSLKDKKAELIHLAAGFENDFSPIEVVNGMVFILTNYKAPKYRVIAINPNFPDEENWIDILPETENTLQNVSLCGNKLFVEYMVDAKSQLEIYSANGERLSNVQLPGICSLGDLHGTKSGFDAFYSYSSYNTPETVIRIHTQTEKSSVYFKPNLKFNPDEIEVKQEFYTSKDGTKIPMFIIHKKGIQLNGKNPAILYGYGGFNISLNPSFSTTVLYYVEAGGVYAIANLRGGGEYGEDWHKAGVLTNKQNVFDDFIAGAEYLIEAGYTNSDQLAIRGGSNGGLLVGAVTNQRPDLFKVALPAVGVMDMLRYQKFTIGYAWATDYGTAADSEEMFEYLLGYSPVHNVVEQDYPAILVTTADHDDRVVPAHSFKYISSIQELNTGKLPTLIRIDVNAGHGAGKPTAKVIEEYTDLFAFVFYYTQN